MVAIVFTTFTTIDQPCSFLLRGVSWKQNIWELASLDKQESDIAEGLKSTVLGIIRSSLVEQNLKPYFKSSTR